MTLVERRDPDIDTALEALTDTRLTIEDRAGAYAVIHQVQLRLNRALRKVKDELIVHMKSNDLKALGPLSIKSTPFDVEWPCNAEGNWGDADVQDTFHNVLLQIAPEFIRKVPAHYEIRTAELGKAVHAGDPLALALHRELKARNWRTEGGRRLSIEVKEAK
jgi:hypothetical protein